MNYIFLILVFSVALLGLFLDRRASGKEPIGRADSHHD